MPEPASQELIDYCRKERSELKLERAIISNEAFRIDFEPVEIAATCCAITEAESPNLCNWQLESMLVAQNDLCEPNR
jgi:hypothetical protein